MDTIKLLLEFSSKTGVAGREGEAAEYGRERLRNYGEMRITPLGNVICAVSRAKENAPHILLDAHIDEIGMIVTYIEEQGFLRVAAVGGIDRRLLLAAPVTVFGFKTVLGVICSIPPHLNKEQDGGKNKKVDEIYIDIGASSREEAEKLTRPGDIVTLDSNPRKLLNGIVTGKAIDDRAGCVSILKALEYLELDKNPLNCGLTVLFSTMEEVGDSPGARTAAYDIAPTHAVAIDVSFAYTPDAKREKCGDLKKGPMIGFAPILEHGISERLCSLAEQGNIPFQREVMGGATGTNADKIATSRGGVRTALISIPQKYMHTPIEAVAVEDVENTARLLAAYVRDISENGGNKHAN